MQRARKKDSRDYRLLVTHHFNERLQRPVLLVLLETVQAFAAFKYQLSVKEERRDHAIRFKVLGLKPPQLDMPAPGHAQYTREYEDLAGTWQLEVEGLDGAVNAFSIRIGHDRVKVLKAPAGGFVELFVDKSLWDSTHS